MMQFFKLLFILILGQIALFANETRVSILPQSQDAVIGTQTVYATITIDQCPDSKPVTITYVNQADTSNTGTIIFENGSCTQSQVALIYIPAGLQEGDSFNVTITGTGQNPQPDPIIENAIATVHIIPPPSNTPTIAISPVTKNIADEMTTVSLNVLASECPNKEDINVTYVNEANTSDTGTVTFSALSCDRVQSFTVNVPAGLGIGDTFDVNISAATSGDQELGAVYPYSATITILDTVSDLNISKTAIIDDSTVISTIAVDQPFQYIIRIQNGGDSTATGIVVNDELPAGLTIDLAQTNSDSGDWSCTLTAPILSCTYNSTISAGGESTIKVTATAPSDPGRITNVAKVYSDNDFDILNNQASATTLVVDTGVVTDICYTNSTKEEDHPSTCSGLTGVSYYTENTSYNCTASMTIRNANTLTSLSSVKVTKLYNPDIDNGACTSDSATATCERKTDLGITDFTSYNGGYEYDLGTFTPDTNITISDSGTFYSGGVIDDIIVYASYEKNGLTYAGKLNACTGGAGTLNVSEYAAQVDAVDDYNTLNGGYVSWVTTKVSGRDNYVMKAVYLGPYGTWPYPQEYYPAGGNLASIHVMFKVVDMEMVDEANGETCEAAEGVTIYQTVNGVPVLDDGGNPIPVYTTIDPGETFSYTDPFEMSFVPSVALESRKNLKFQYQTVDFNQLITDSGIQCVNRSSTGGVVEGIPACMIAQDNGTPDQQNTAIENYIAVFGEDAYESCYNENGQPCWASNGGVGEYPYNTELGCFECSIGAFPKVCSHDNFAIRPDKFTIDSNDISYPDLLRAGQGYDLLVNAVDHNTGLNSVGYNQTSNYLDVSDPIKYWGDGGEANASMFGTAVWGSDFNITNGYTTIGGIATPVPYEYDEVGDISTHIQDSTWAAVDINNPDDPTAHDCSLDGAYICGDRNATFIPHHFSVTIDNLHNNGENDTFTYLSNDLNMSARFGVTIISQNEHNATTKNFTQPQFGHAFYENPMTVLLTAPNNPAGNSANTLEIASELLLGFDGGVKDIPWNESNGSLRLGFNYLRATNTAVNPFMVFGTQARVDAKSVYTGTAAENGGTVDIIGNDTSADQNVTFVYGRAHAPRFRAMCDGAAACPGNVTFFYEFYADQDANATLINTLLGADKRRSIDSVNWYRNNKHDTSTDGNISGTSQNIPGDLVHNAGQFSHTTQTSASTYSYSGTSGYPYKGTITIPQSSVAGAPSWLIYDKYQPDSNTTAMQSELEYYGPGTWTSTGKLDTHSSDNPTKSRNTNRRIRW